jgi:tRNA (guanine-N7-)-methyltransferase
VTLLSAKLRAGGLLHCATDDQGYAEWMLETLTAEPSLHNRFEGYAPRPDSRPVTKFEQRALAAGRTPADLMFVKS